MVTQYSYGNSASYSTAFLYQSTSTGTRANSVTNDYTTGKFYWGGSLKDSSGTFYSSITSMQSAGNI